MQADKLCFGSEYAQTCGLGALLTCRLIGMLMAQEIIRLAHGWRYRAPNFDFFFFSFFICHSRNNEKRVFLIPSVILLGGKFDV